MAQDAKGRARGATEGERMGQHLPHKAWQEGSTRMAGPFQGQAWRLGRQGAALCEAEAF